ncbi:MAG TPA: SelB C-terminal domain-containing protein [Trebonia sp.]|nr:SelB C-terminal domain-containing protein [Trebonia sp.]
MYVVATAGHVDHGKSTLVRALTGMEPDRWAEERRRGMTIDLGYAWMTLPGGEGPAGPRPQEKRPAGPRPQEKRPAGPRQQEKMAFVDVPGHERFVPNMLAGLGPVPAVLFVVAADGGWMPQSAEHLAAVDALGVRHGILVVTRADLADPGPAARQALAEIAKTSLGQVEAVAVSAVTGAGMDRLRDALARLAASLPGADPAAPVRLWIDRSFSIKGSGTVVTGTLPAGTVRNGQELLLTPSAQPVRVRGLQALGEPAGQVTGVARVALNLRGIPTGVPERGMALVEPGRWTLTAELDVRITAGAAGLPARFPPGLLLHIGSARTPARLRLLGEGPGERQAPGERRGPGAVYARLRLRDPLPLHVGDRVLLRDPGAAGLAIYGATVLDPAPPPLARRGAAAAAARELAAWPEVPAAADLLRRHGLLRAGSLAATGAAGLPGPVAGDWLADPAHWARLRDELAKAVGAFTARDPLAQGMPADAARAALRLPSRDLVVALARDAVVLDGGYLRPAAPSALAGPQEPAGTGTAGRPQPGAPSQPARPGAPSQPSQPGAPSQPGVPALPPAVARAVQALLDDLAKDPFAAPDADRLRELRLDGKALAAAARRGLLLRVAESVVLAPGADADAARLLGQLPQPFTTSQARQALGTSRRVVIPLLEYLDRTRVTERLPGDLRRLRPR